MPEVRRLLHALSESQDVTASETLAVIRHRFMELYFPRSPQWRRSLISETERVLPVVLKRFIGGCRSGMEAEGLLTPH